MFTKYVWYDDFVKGKDGFRKPFWNFVTTTKELKDQELIWLHEGYGLMRLYRTWAVDSKNFIAEKLSTVCRTNDVRWPEWSSHPDLAL